MPDRRKPRRQAAKPGMTGEDSIRVGSKVKVRLTAEATAVRYPSHRMALWTVTHITPANHDRPAVYTLAWGIQTIRVSASQIKAVKEAAR